MVQTDAVDNLDFRWGIKRGRGGVKKDVQFYESFTYDGEEYFLYDSVYLFEDGQTDPYIGKLIKIWEHPNKSRKVKVLWFFRPSEISKYLGDLKALENELFLASGDGKGLANINPLEAIAGKCNVVCISKDERNQQPSLEELNMADHIFYRTFDVSKFTISDKLGEKIATVDVKFLFNKNDPQKSTLPSTEPIFKGQSEDFVASAEKGLVSQEKDTGKTLEPDADSGSLFSRKFVVDLGKHAPMCNADGAATNVGKIALKPSGGYGFCGEKMVGSKHAELESMKDSTTSLQKSDIGDRPTLDLEGGTKYSSGDNKKIIEEKGCDFGVNGFKYSLSQSRVADKKLKTEFSKNSLKPCEATEKVKCSEDIGTLDGRLSKKLKSGEYTRSSNTLKSAVDADDSNLKESSTPIVSNDKRKHESNEDPHSPFKSMGTAKSADNYGALDGHPSKKLKSSEHVGSSMQNLASDSAGGKIKPPLSAALAGDSKLKSVVKHGANTCLSKKPINGGIMKKLPDDKFHITPSKQISKEDARVYGRVVEVTRRPDADNSKWFTGLPWEDRMKAAQEEGTLVLLQNLDPTYTSSEVEDIIWHSFHENCTSRVLQRTAITSPHSGQAFVIFKTKQAAERIVRELEQGCLMLPNGRPLLAHVQVSHLHGKLSSFPGHLIIDRLKFQMQKEKREAVSTSHSSQPNTLEYDMAMEWRILQERSEFMWRNMFKQQGEELMRLRRNLKRK